MKEHLLYLVLFSSLLFSIIIPLDWGFWWGFYRGACMAIFIMLIPLWVETRRGR